VPSRGGTARIVIATSIGNALEFYDIIIYGLFALQISRTFFPSGDPTVSLLLAWGTFGITFVARPLGAVVLGAFADRAGRKAALTLGILLMTLGTLLLVAMPGYATLGLAAPFGVFAARLMQGFAVGGEFGSATAMMIEHRPDRPGFFASFQFSSQSLSGTLASLLAIAVTTLLTPEQVQFWGWRIPFAFGVLVGPVGLYIRRHVDETPAFLGGGGAQRPVRELFLRQWPALLIGMGVLALGTGVTYLGLYMPTFAVRQLGVPAAASFLVPLINGVLLLVLIPFIGHLSDRLGRTRTMPAAAVLVMLLVYPGFHYLTAHPTLRTLLSLAVVNAILQLFYIASMPALMAELFPVRTRSSGMSISYSFGVMTFGGFAPAIITWLIPRTNRSLAPSLYVIACALVSLTALTAARWRRHPG
jgi:MHS family proline/betaine transporter-like MFS transporter